MATKNHKAKPKTSAADDAVRELNVLWEKLAEMMDKMECADNDDKQVPKRAGHKGKERTSKVILLWALFERRMSSSWNAESPRLVVVVI